jgi:hypothetical protein
MIRLTVAEDEALLSICGVPVYHPYPGLTATLANQPLGDIDPVVKYCYLIARLPQERAGGQAGEESRVKITAEHRLGLRLGVECGPSVEPKRAGQGMLSHRQTGHRVCGDLPGRHIQGEPPGKLPILSREILAVPVHREPQLAEDLGPRIKAAVTKVSRRPVAGELSLIRVPGHIRCQAGGQGSIAEEHLDFSTPQRECRRQRTLQ